MTISSRLRLTAALLAAALGMSSAHADGHSGHPAPMPMDTPSADHRAAPKLVLSEPRADILKGGYVYLPFRVDNMRLLPIYTEIDGQEATQLTPRIGHLHVGVDDHPWVWIHASADPIYFGQLPSGPHKVKLELVDAAHRLIEVQTINITVP